MRNIIQVGIYALALGTSIAGFAAGTEEVVAAKGTELLKVATAAAVGKFKEKVGAEAGKNTGLLTITKGDEDVVVAVSYKEADASKTASFHCKGNPVACEQPAAPADATVAVLARANAKWGIDELKTSTEFALGEFKKAMPDADEDVTLVTVKKNIQGNAAKVLIEYGAEEPQEYFCHNHGDHIDCH